MRSLRSEKEVMEIADALVETGLSKLGYDTVLLDDCWSVGACCWISTGAGAWTVGWVVDCPWWF